MRHHIATVAVILLSCAGVTAAHASSAAPPPDDPPTGTALLVTGDRITARPSVDGHRSIVVQHAADKGVGRVMVHLSRGARSYAVPAAALPYLGRGLDWNLFDVDTVLQAQRDRQPTEQAVTAAKEFGATLVNKFLDDRKHGTYRPLEPAMSTPGAPATPAKKQPASVMRTLTVTANGPDGTPDTGDVAVVFNTDDGNLFDVNESDSVFAHGAAKFSVPDGHYSVLGLFFETDAGGNVTAVRYSARPEVTVSGDTSTAVDAQAASSKVTWDTPRPALSEDGGFLLRREPTVGPALTVDLAVGPGVPVFVSPTGEPVTTGKLQSYPYNRLSSPPGPGTPYEYTLQRATTGVIPEQHYTVTTADLATIDANYYSEVNSVGARQRAGRYPFEDDTVRTSHQIVLPRSQTEYVSADPAILWYGGLGKYVSPKFLSWFGGQYEAAHHYQPGTSLREDWNRFPLHPAGTADRLPSDVPWSTVPPVTRQGDDLRIHLTPFTDNEPGHTGFGFAGESRDDLAGSYVLRQNGTQIAGGPISRGQVDFTTKASVDPAPATLQLSLDATREGPMYLLSTASHTEWTWKSQHVSGGSLPVPYACEPVDGGQPARDCAVEPLMTLRYLVGDLDVRGTAPNGPQTVDVTVDHLQPGSGTEVAGATAQFSLDNGTTWQDAAVANRGNGSFRATFDATAPTNRGTDVALRVTATDADGGQISETLLHAYQTFN
ncbi:hypothetical protein [Amycolatopsis sp. NPDC051061]|uniref:hypothetical protein n=1 Tax=Amycolatopsis sp. NPDC051061 TaxID=3155042 RepID=UPI003416ED87